MDDAIIYAINSKNLEKSANCDADQPISRSLSEKTSKRDLATSAPEGWPPPGRWFGGQYKYNFRRFQISMSSSGQPVVRTAESHAFLG